MKSAEEILKELYCCEPTDEKQDLQLQITLNPDLDRILQAMHEYASQSRWVKVSERLPEVGERVLLLIECIGEPYVCIGHMKKDGLYYKDKGTLSKPMEIVIRWQPLPTPPKD